VRWFHDRLHEDVFPKIKEEQKERTKVDVSKTIVDLARIYLKENRIRQEVVLRKLGKSEGLFQETERNPL